MSGKRFTKVGLVGGGFAVALLTLSVTLQGAPGESAEIKGEDAPTTPTIGSVKKNETRISADAERGGDPTVFFAPTRSVHDDELVPIIDAVADGKGSTAGRGGARGEAALGEPCTCDDDCAQPDPNTCTSAECILGVCTADNLPQGSDCDSDGSFCTNEQCDGDGNCIQEGSGVECFYECVGGPDDGIDCDDDQDCQNPGTCEPHNGSTCNETADHCEVQDGGGLVIGRCCTAGVFSADTEANCTGGGGFWYRVRNPDDLLDTFCPVYSAGVAPQEAGVTPVGPVVQSNRVCQTGGDSCDDDTYCQKRCSGGADDGLICEVDSDCDGPNPCLVDPCIVATPARCDGIRNLGDEYDTGGSSHFRLTKFRFRGGVRDAGEVVFFEFYDNSSPPKFIRSVGVRLGTSGVDDWTITTDCFPNCDPVEEEQERDIPLMLPPQGHVVVRSTRAEFVPGPNADPPTRANFTWMSASGIQVGTGDANGLWLDDDPANNFLGAGNNTLILELFGVPVADPFGACCDPSTGACTDVPEWQCRNCQNDDGTAGAVCEESIPDCGFVAGKCLPLNWFGPLQRQDFDTAGNCVASDCATCADNPGPCDAGACCLGDGTCTSEENETDCDNAGGAWQGFGSNCDPNCCQQPTLSGGDLCSTAPPTVIRVLPTAGSGAGECVCPDPEHPGGVCNSAGGGVDGDSCSILFPGNCPDECTEGPVVVTLSGDSSLAVIDQAGGDDCTQSPLDAGWFETIVVDKAATVTFDQCCTVTDAAFFFANLREDCDCSAGAQGIDPDVNNEGTIKTGADADVVCDDGNASATYVVRPGTYTYQLYGPRTCQNTATTCTIDEDCAQGVACVDNAGPYQIHVTVDAAPSAACCLADACLGPMDEFKCTTDGLCGTGPDVCVGGGNPGSACDDDTDCTAGGICGLPALCEVNDEGYEGPTFGDVCTSDEDCRAGFWLGELSDGTAVADCSGSPCDEGLCCYEDPPVEGAGLCDDTFGGQPAEPSDCDVPAGDFIGGATCADNPCPICVQPQSNCQEEFLRFILLSDLALDLPTPRADDFRPNTDTLKNMCFSPAFVGFNPGVFECSDPGETPRDFWYAHIYEDDNGAPGLELLPTGVTTDGQLLDVVAKQARGGSSRVWDYRVQFPIEYSPLTGAPLQPGDCYWMQLAGTGEGENGCRTWLLESNPEAGANGYGMIDLEGDVAQGGDWGPEDVTFYTDFPGGEAYADGADLQFCIDAVLDPDANGCSTDTPPVSTHAIPIQAEIKSGHVAPCLLCGDPVVCENRNFEDCYNNGGRFMAGFDDCAEVLGAGFPSAAPPNDDCASATPICTGLENCNVLLDTTCASTDGEVSTCQPYVGRADVAAEPDFYDFEQDVWFEYTPPCSGQILLDTCSTLTKVDSMIAVYTTGEATCGNSCPEDGSLVCVNAGASNGNPCSVDSDCGTGGFCLPDNVLMLPPVTGSNESLPACADDELETDLIPDLECLNGGISGRSVMAFNVSGDTCYKIRVGGFEGSYVRSHGPMELSIDVSCVSVTEPAVADAPHDGPKNRYLSFNPNNAAAAVGFELTLPDGRIAYVGEPALVDDRGSDPHFVSDVVDTPVIRSWELEPVVHIRGCPIVPDESYELRTTTGSELSPPLVLATVPDPGLAGSWADCVGTFDSGAGLWTGPNDATNFNDIAATIDQFQQKGTNPVTWTDVADLIPNYVTNFGDIGAVISGFQENDYWDVIPDHSQIPDCVIPAP